MMDETLDGIAQGHFFLLFLMKTKVSYKREQMQLCKRQQVSGWPD
jgi:hypothetical protein